MLSIRDVDPERDAEPIVAMLREAQPSSVITPESWLHRVSSLPKRAETRGFVAVDRGRVVGNGYALRSFFTAGAESATCYVGVAASHRRRGIGRALWEQVDEHARSLRPTMLTTLFEENSDGVAFADRCGFREERAETVSGLDPRIVAERPPPEVDIRPVSACDPRDAYLVDLESTLDMPSLEPPDDMPYAEWEQHILQHPLFSEAGSFLAYADGEAAAISLLSTDGAGRAMTLYTGTRRDFRGRGLARAVKLASIEWAARNGIAVMLTSNDETNAPMLAVNRRLGYRPVSRRVEYVKPL